MRESIEGLYDTCGCVVATIIIILALAVVLGIVFGVYCFEGWLLMLVWNAVANEMFGLPMIGYWASVGVVWVLNLIAGAFKIKTKKE